MAHFQKFCRLFPCCYLQHIFWVGVVIQRTIYSMYNFIFAAAGVVIRGTFCKKSLFSVPSLLLFTAQFPQKFLLGLLFSAQFRKNSAFAGQIVSLDTILRIFAGCCYSRHNLIFWEFSGIFAKFPIFLPLLLFAAQFPQKSFLNFWVLESSAQFEWFPEFQQSHLWDCYSAHSSQNPPNRHRTILAQKIIFSGCYARHIVALRTKQLLFTAHRSWNPRHTSVVIFDTATHYF